MSVPSPRDRVLTTSLLQSRREEEEGVPPAPSFYRVPEPLTNPPYPGPFHGSLNVELPSSIPNQDPGIRAYSPLYCNTHNPSSVLYSHSRVGTDYRFLGPSL